MIRENGSTIGHSLCNRSDCVMMQLYPPATIVA